MTNEIDPRELIPLKTDAHVVLLTLLDGDAYGYALLRAADGRTRRRGHLQPGSLYRLLREMLAAGLIERLDPAAAPSDADERRRYYRVTAFGREVAALESARLERLVDVARELDLLGEEGRA